MSWRRNCEKLNVEKFCITESQRVNVLYPALKLPGNNLRHVEITGIEISERVIRLHSHIEVVSYEICGAL